jgi:hypothetical protein
MPFKKVYPRCVCFLSSYSNSIYKEILISEEVSNFRNVEALFFEGSMSTFETKFC